jgi:hypothetical protein
VGAVHAVQAVLILVLANDFALPVTAVYQDGPPGASLGEPVQLFEVRFAWVIAVFLLFAAVDHVLMATAARRWYERQLGERRNPARWMEYSISSSLMVVLIAMLTGINSAYALIGIFGANTAMILFGLMMEQVNPGRGRVNWWPFVFGCIAGITPWIAITLAIVGAGNEFGGVPTFVYAIFISLFVFYNSFAVNMVLQYKRVGPWRSYLFGEGAYIVLSLGAKSALAWQVFGGTLAT